MLVEGCGDVVLCCGLPADLLALCLGVLHPAFHSCPYHRQFQLTENARHLYPEGKECY